MNIGIIGTGNIAKFLLETIDKENEMHITSIFGRNVEVGRKLSAFYEVDFYRNVHDFLKSSVDIVVEAATVQAAKELTVDVLHSGKDIILSSVGVMSDPLFYKEVKEISKMKENNIYIPSGAIGGIDIIKAANSLGELEKVSILTRKPPKSLAIEENLKSETTIFKGNAGNAITQFPKNINISIILSLAGLGEEKTVVTIIADPLVSKNSHTIEAIGEFGRLDLTVENESMPSNSKTSYLAALSILSLLQNKDQNIKIGS